MDRKLSQAHYVPTSTALCAPLRHDLGLKSVSKGLNETKRAYGAINRPGFHLELAHEFERLYWSCLHGYYLRVAPPHGGLIF